MEIAEGKASRPQHHHKELGILRDKNEVLGKTAVRPAGPAD